MALHPGFSVAALTGESQAGKARFCAAGFFFSFHASPSCAILDEDAAESKLACTEICMIHTVQAVSDVFPHLVTASDVPTLVKVGDVDWTDIDAAFCCLPHATTQDIIKSLPSHIKIVDLSADFRLKDTAVYAEWCKQLLMTLHASKGCNSG